MCRIIKHGLILCRKKGICRWKIFCPASTYFHKLYGGQDNLTYQTEAQMNGTNAHKVIRIQYSVFEIDNSDRIKDNIITENTNLASNICR